MPLLTVEQLRERLGWADVREELLLGSERTLRVVPADEPLASIYLHVHDGDGHSRIYTLGTGRWHCHPDDVDEAIEMVRKLVHHELCILEQYDRAGQYRSSGPVAPGEVMSTLCHDAGYVVRLFFGLPARRERIDFKRYHRAEHSYVERGFQALMDEARHGGRVAGWLSRPLVSDDIEVWQGRPTPCLSVGDRVRSVAGTVEGLVVRTEVEVAVAWYAWHRQRGRWMYRLALPNRRRRRWYFDEQLVKVG